MAKPRGGKSNKGSNVPPKPCPVIKKKVQNFHQNGQNYTHRRAHQNFVVSASENRDSVSQHARNVKFIQSQKSENQRKKEMEKPMFNLSGGLEDIFPGDLSAKNILAYGASMTAPDSETESVIEEVQTVTLEDEDSKKKEIVVIDIEDGEIVTESEDGDVVEIPSSSTNKFSATKRPFLATSTSKNVVVEKMTAETSKIAVNSVSSCDHYADVSDDDDDVQIEKEVVVVAVKRTPNSTGTKRKTKKLPELSPSLLKNPPPTSSAGCWYGYDRSKDGLEGTCTQHAETADKTADKSVAGLNLLPRLDVPPPYLKCSNHKVVIQRTLEYPKVQRVHPLLLPADYLDSASLLISMDKRQHFRGPENLSPTFINQLLPVDGRIFRLVCYNILCQTAMDDNRYLYPHYPTYISHKMWNNRLLLLVDELKRLSADVYCLQEVEDNAYHLNFLPLMKSRGYSGFYTKREGKADGCAMFWRDSRFAMVKYEGINLNFGVRGLDKPNVAQITVLKHAMTGKNIMFVNTHILFAPKRGDIKLNQLAVILAHMKNLNKDVQHVVFSGDLNTEPKSPIYKFLRNGSLETNKANRLFASTLSGQCNKVVGPQMENFFLPAVAKVNFDCIMTPTIMPMKPSTHLRHGFNFASCYDHCTKTGGREVSTFHRDVGNPDHIFYSVAKVVDRPDNRSCEVHENGLHLLRRMTLPDVDAFSNICGPLPNGFTGSDHIPLLVEFYLY